MIWIDTDVALGGERGDVDDGYALAALFAASRRGDAAVAGISTVFGNTSARLSEGFARRIAELSGISLPVVRGAERPGETGAAAERIASLEADTELLALGPLTNVAAACRLDASLPGRTLLRAVGSNLSSRGLLPPLWPFEFNFARDRESARFALSREWREIRLYPLDVVRRLRIGRRDLARLAAASPLGAHLAAGSSRWLARAAWRHRDRRFPLWDLPAALDCAGLASAVHERRSLAAGARRWLATKRDFSCLVSFDPDGAWGRFLDLIGDATMASL